MSHEREHDRSLLKVAGEMIGSNPEFNHSTQYYRVNPAKAEGMGLKCSANYCRSDDPTPLVMQYEIDHFKQVWIEFFCRECAPKRLLDQI